MTRRWIGWLCALLLAPTIAGHCRAQSVLGYHGSPDRSSGPHVHYEVRVNDEPQDPKKFIGLARVIPAAER